MCAQHRLARLAFVTSCTLVFSAQPSVAQSFDEIAKSAIDPTSYILERAQQNRIVLLGEAHWIRSDAHLLAQLVTRLPEAGVTAFAAEWLPAAQQPQLDSLMAGLAWNEGLALRVLREAGWPYYEYLDIMRAAWAANHRPESARFTLRLLGVGPGFNWRGRLPDGVNSEQYLANHVRAALADRSSRVVVSLGLHHAFTRYYLPDLPERLVPKVGSFSDRAGNILWRALGQRVFTIILHHPWTCWIGDDWGRCLPFSGALDCAFIRNGVPLGFDARGPAGAVKLDSTYWYSLGYPSITLQDLADGYVWSGPIETFENVRVIPLEIFAPDSAALATVLENNPVTSDSVRSRTELARRWTDYSTAFQNAQETRRWARLAGWRAVCSGIGDAGIRPKPWKK